MEVCVRLWRAEGQHGRLLGRYQRGRQGSVGLLAVIVCGVVAAQVVGPLIAGRFIDRAVAGGDLRELIGLAVLAIVIALTRQGLAIAETYVAERISWAATNALRADLLAHLLRLDDSFHSAHAPGLLIERVDGDVTTLARFFSRFVVYVVGNAFFILVVLVLLWLVDWRIGLGLSLFVALAFAAMLRMRAVATPFWAAERQATAEFYGFIGDYLSGLEDIRSSGAGAFVMRRCASMMRSWLSAVRRAQLCGYALVAASQGLFALGTALAFAVSAMLYWADLLTIGTVYLVFQYTELLRLPTEQIRNEVQDVQQADASLGRIGQLLAITPSMVDGPGAALPAGPLAVELDQVSFAYADGTPVLRNVSLSVPAGRVLGIVGHTGSGKTTITRLVQRLYDPQQGVVRLGGVDVRAVERVAVRSRIGLVTQEVQLFSASVRDNLTIFDERVADERLVAALDSMGLAEWLRGLPAGLETQLGADGVGLSAGQAQLLACARIVLQAPDLVILDEPSSRLDPESERLVSAALGRLLQGRTGIVVAHRLATVAATDEILVLEDGQVRERGAWSALAGDPDSRLAALLRAGAGEVDR